MKTSSLLLLPLALVLLCPSHAAAQVNITTWDCDLTHSGVNPNETILTPANVNTANNFGVLFTQPLDNQNYGQILYASNINVAGTTHNIVYVGTEGDSMYAFDADN